MGPAICFLVLAIVCGFMILTTSHKYWNKKKPLWKQAEELGEKENDTTKL